MNDEQVKKYIKKPANNDAHEKHFRPVHFE